MSASFNAKLIAGFVLAFFAGGAAGVFFTFHHARHWRADFAHHPHLLTERMRDRIKDQLDLTPQQLVKIQPILDRATNELQKIRAESGTKVRQVIAETDRALQPELTEAQRIRLQKIQQTAPDERRPRHRGPRPAD